MYEEINSLFEKVTRTINIITEEVLRRSRDRVVDNER